MLDKKMSQSSLNRLSEAKFTELTPNHFSYFERLIPYYHENFDFAFQHTYLQPMLEQINLLSDTDFQIMKQRLPRPAKIEPNTIASYLFGSDFTHYGEVSAECSPLSIFSRDYEGQCSAQVWLLEWNHKLKQIQDTPNAKQAYVFMETYVKDLSEEQKEQLKEARVEKVVLYAFNNQNHQLIKSFDLRQYNPDKHSIWKVREKKEKKNEEMEIEPKTFFEEAKEDTVLWFFIPLAFILLILFFLF